MRQAKLHELTLPTRYAVWRKYIHGTELQTQIGPETFADLLNQRQAIELVNQKGIILCKTLNETLIQQTLKELFSRPYQSVWSLYLRRLVRRLTLHLTSGTPKPTL